MRAQLEKRGLRCGSDKKGGMLCYGYVCTRHVRWDDARAHVIMCVHRAGKSTI